MGEKRYVDEPEEDKARYLQQHHHPHHHHNTTELIDLPIEIPIDILSKLPVNSVRCLQCLSKAVLNTVDDLTFVTLHTQRLLGINCPSGVPRLLLLIQSPRGYIVHPKKYQGSNALKTNFLKQEQQTSNCFPVLVQTAL